ncbi:MAG: hypothetical protein ACPGSM_21645, partial [Thiolinea sp.]
HQISKDGRQGFSNAQRLLANEAKTLKRLKNFSNALKPFFLLEPPRLHTTPHKQEVRYIKMTNA